MTDRELIIAKIVLRGTTYLEPDQWERAGARKKDACHKIAKEILAALAVHGEPTGRVGPGMERGRPDDELEAALNADNPDPCPIAAREDTEWEGNHESI